MVCDQREFVKALSCSNQNQLYKAISKIYNDFLPETEPSLAELYGF